SYLYPALLVYSFTLILAGVILFDKEMRSFLYFQAVAAALIENAISGLLRLPMLTEVNGFCIFQATVKIFTGMCMFMHLTVTGLVLPLLLPQNRSMLTRVNVPRVTRRIILAPYLIAAILTFITYKAGKMGLSSDDIEDYCFVVAGNVFWSTLDFYGWLGLFIFVTLGAVIYTTMQIVRQNYSDGGVSKIPQRSKRMFLLPLVF
ncbi:hypothetical protein KIPB_007740, partial [Kipferlia bialata]